MGTAAVFIDGGHLTEVLKRLGGPRIDYHKFAERVCGEGDLLRAYYYDCLPYQSEEPTPEERTRVGNKMRFFSALRRGPRFTVREGRLEYRGRNDKGEAIFVQKRVDLQMGVDFTRLVSKRVVDTLIIVTGDSDFIPAVEFAQEQGVIVRLIHGPQGTYHNELWEAVDEREEISHDMIKSLLRE
jgi:uncharacterized LabA/DUF88 family protein